MMEKLQKPAFWLALIGALKLVTNAFGIQLISDQQVNEIANGLAALVTVVGVVTDHGKPVVANSATTELSSNPEQLNK